MPSNWNGRPVGNAHGPLLAQISTFIFYDGNSAGALPSSSANLRRILPERCNLQFPWINRTTRITIPPRSSVWCSLDNKQSGLGANSTLPRLIGRYITQFLSILWNCYNFCFDLEYTGLPCDNYIRIIIRDYTSNSINSVHFMDFLRNL